MKVMIIVLAILIGCSALASDYLPEYDQLAEDALRSPRWFLPGEEQEITAPNRDNLHEFIPPPEVIYQEWLDEQKLMNRYWCPCMEEVQYLSTTEEPPEEPVVDMLQMYWEDIWRARNPLQYEDESEPKVIRHIEFKSETPTFDGRGLTIIMIEF